MHGGAYRETHYPNQSAAQAPGDMCHLCNTKYLLYSGVRRAENIINVLKAKTERFDWFAQGKRTRLIGNGHQMLPFIGAS